MTFSVRIRISQTIADEYTARSTFPDEDEWIAVLSSAGVHEVPIATVTAMLADAQFQIHQDGPFGAAARGDDLPIRNAYAALEEQLRGVVAESQTIYPAIAAPPVLRRDEASRSERCLDDREHARATSSPARSG